MSKPNLSNPCRWGKRPKGRSACSLTRWQRRQLSRRATAFNRAWAPAWLNARFDALFDSYITNALRL